jgi:peptide deformylase
VPLGATNEKKKKKKKKKKKNQCSTITLWDDCMSHPDLLALVTRHRHVDLSFTDVHTGARISLNRCDEVLSELLQHECDHLAGVLAIDIAAQTVTRTEYEADRAKWDAMVDRSIEPVGKVSPKAGSKECPQIPADMFEAVMAG